MVHQDPSTAPREVRHEPDDIDRRLLNALQGAFPLTPTPYRDIGELLELDETAVIDRIERLREARIIRQISAIFDSRRLGYSSSLVAMEFPPEEVDAGAAVISLHPGVSHNYRRNHRYNLWFTIATPPHKVLAAEVAALAERARPLRTWLLPTLRLFKIGVNLDATGATDAAAREEPEESIGVRSADGWEPAPTVVELSDEELAAIRILQRDLPGNPRPFAPLAAEAGLSEQRLLELAAAMLADRRMRRYAAVLHHRRAGFRANAMGVWVVPEDRIDEVGPQMASFKAVSHCYQRPTYPDWPYSIFTMIHGRHADDCEAAVAAIRDATGISDYALLYSTKEYKKTRVRYFLDDDRFDVSSIAPR